MIRNFLFAPGSPATHDAKNLLLIVAAVEILASTGCADIALGTPLRRWIFPDVIGQPTMGEGDAAAVILFPILIGHIVLFHVFLNLDKTHIAHSFP